MFVLEALCYGLPTAEIMLDGQRLEVIKDRGAGELGGIGPDEPDVPVHVLDGGVVKVVDDVVQKGRVQPTQQRGLAHEPLIEGDVDREEVVVPAEVADGPVGEGELDVVGRPSGQVDVDAGVVLADDQLHPGTEETADHELAAHGPVQLGRLDHFIFAAPFREELDALGLWRRRRGLGSSTGSLRATGTGAGNRSQGGARGLRAQARRRAARERVDDWVGQGRERLEVADRCAKGSIRGLDLRFDRRQGGRGCGRDVYPIMMRPRGIIGTQPCGGG